MEIIINQAAALVIAVVLPFVIALLQGETWSANVKNWIAIAICALTGAAYMVTSGIAITPENITAVVMVFVGGTQIAYRAFKGIGITSKFLDALTSVKVVIDKADDKTTDQAA